jgi:hypothetical protein
VLIPEEKLQVADHKDGGWEYTQVDRQSKMEIPAEYDL